MLRPRRSNPLLAFFVPVLLSVAVVCPAVTQDTPRALPEREAFLHAVKAKLKRDDKGVAAYAYIESEVQVEFDADRRATKRTEKIYEVYPFDGDESYRRLVATDGVPTDPRRLAETDRRQREKVAEWTRDRQRESPVNRAVRLRKEAEARDADARSIEDVFRVFDMRLAGREFVRGRPAIAVTFTPRPGVQPSSDDLDVLTKVRGRAWIDEQDCELARVEAETLDTITWGLGVLARVYKGTTVTFERQKVNNEIWLPTRMVAHPRARIALLKRYDTETTREYSDYRKVSAEPATTFVFPRSGR